MVANVRQLQKELASKGKGQWIQPAKLTTTWVGEANYGQEMSGSDSTDSSPNLMQQLLEAKKQLKCLMTILLTINYIHGLRNPSSVIWLRLNESSSSFNLNAGCLSNATKAQIFVMVMTCFVSSATAAMRLQRKKHVQVWVWEEWLTAPLHHSVYLPRVLGAPSDT